MIHLKLYENFGSKNYREISYEERIDLRKSLISHENLVKFDKFEVKTLYKLGLEVDKKGDSIYGYLPYKIYSTGYTQKEFLEIKKYKDDWFELLSDHKTYICDQFDSLLDLIENKFILN